MQEAIQRETTKMQTQERRRKCEMEEDANRTEDMEDIYNQIKEEASEMEQSP